jgi:hypothetical protein
MFDREECENKIFAPLPAVLFIRRLSYPPSFLSAVFVAEWRACSAICQE